jgi:RNA polymerase sigma-70 factor, ECF subfamily
MRTEPASDTDTVFDTARDTGLNAGLGDEAQSAEQLLTLVTQGDERAFGLFYDQLAVPVMSMVHAVVRDHAQSEEVVQEVFVELWRTAPRFRPERSGAYAWAMTIAHHRAVDRVRSSQTHAAREHAAQVRDYSGGGHDGVVKQVLDNLEPGQGRECLRALTALERESILLTYYRALTYRQVAETLHVATGTVKYRMRAGLRRLRDCLALDTISSAGAPSGNGHDATAKKTIG